MMHLNEQRKIHLLLLVCIHLYTTVSRPQAMASDYLDMPVGGAAPLDMPAIPPAAPVSSQPAQISTPVLNTGGATAPSEAEYTQEQTGIQGNWQKKRAWLLQANDLFAKEIDPLMTKIYANRNIFNAQFNSIDQALDDFYKEMGFEQGKLQELFSSIERYLNKKREEQLALLLTSKESMSLSERDYSLKTDDVETSIKDLHARLEQLRLDMKSIEDIDSSLSMRLKKLDAEIANAVQEEAAARKIIDTIWHVIDDRKARDLFYDLQNKSVEKIKAIHNYLSNDLLNDFTSVITNAQNQIDRVKREYQQLEQDGIIIKDRSSRVEKIKKEQQAALALEKKALQEAEILRVKRAEQQAQRKPLQQSWYARIILFFSSLWENILALFHATPQPVKKIKPAQQPSTELPPPPAPSFDHADEKLEKAPPELPAIPLS